MKNFFSLNLFLILFPLISLGQTAENRPVYKWFDEVIGPENSGLINGVEYTELHRTINEKHKFFQSTNFTSGVLQYNGQPYYDVDIKYNIHGQLLLARIDHSFGETILQLINERIDAFTIHGRQFINIKDPEGNKKGVTGFYEVLLTNPELSLFKKHSRQMKKRLGDKFVYYEFDPQNNDPVLYYNGDYYHISSRRDLLKVFPEVKKEIRSYYRTNRKFRRSNPDKFMTNLLQELTAVRSEYNAVKE